MNKKIVAVCLLTLISLVGCSEEPSPKLLLVTFPTKVYKTHTGECMDYAFTLDPGDTCAIGLTKQEKVFSFVEVVSTKGYGWILDQTGYRIIGRSSFSKDKSLH